MQVQELPAKEFLAHLRRHPIPEIMDDECLNALASVEAQYGDTITHGAGLEVRREKRGRLPNPGKSLLRSKPCARRKRPQAARAVLMGAMLRQGFKLLVEEWWHLTLEDEPYPDTYFTFPVRRLGA